MSLYKSMDQTGQSLHGSMWLIYAAACIKSECTNHDYYQKRNGSDFIVCHGIVPPTTFMSLCQQQYLLPPPLKVDGGDVFTPVCVCLFVCEQNISKLQTDLVENLGMWRGQIDSILVKIQMWIWEFFLTDSLPLNGRMKTTYSTRFQKVVDGFRRTLVGRLGM